jgi:hypothetical protein
MQSDVVQVENKPLGYRFILLGALIRWVIITGLMLTACAVHEKSLFA